MQQKKRLRDRAADAKRIQDLERQVCNNRTVFRLTFISDKVSYNTHQPFQKIKALSEALW